MAASTTPARPFEAALLEHAQRGVRLQLGLRAMLVAFAALTLVAVPPVRGTAICAVVVVAYLVWAVGFAVWVCRGRPEPIRLAWLALFVDVAVLGFLTLLTGLAAQQSWTADVLVNGFFVIPVLAATDLRPRVCAAVVVPTVLASLASSVATRTANAEPWASIVLHHALLTAVGGGCVVLSRIQRSRVRRIGGLLVERSGMLDELAGLEDRERRRLADHLHDGVLQFVLAARQDLDDLRDGTQPGVVGRLDHALAESSRLLRSTVTGLHPAVLDQAGLARAVQDLARSEAERGGLAVDLDTSGWPDDLRTPLDSLLHSTARELLGNVVKHAGARSVRVELGVRDRMAWLVVRDDGCGVEPEHLDEQLARGHIGLRSHQLRLAAAGGALRVVAAIPTGTLATAEVPLPA